MKPGALTDAERQRYRQARDGGRIVRVFNALCFGCVRKAIGRVSIARIPGAVIPYQVQDTCERHAHMTLPCGNAAKSAAMARAARATLAPKRVL